MNFPEYPTITRQLPARQLASFPATGPLGWFTLAWLWWLKRHLNRDRYKLTLKGRAAKRPELRGYGGSIKLKNARKWGLYIDDKMDAKLSAYSEAVGRYRAQGEARKLADQLQAERGLVEAHETAQAALIDKLERTRRKLEKARDEVAAVQLQATRDQLAANKSNQAIDKIWCELNGSEWNADTTDRIAAHVRNLGYKIGDVGEPLNGKGGQ